MKIYLTGASADKRIQAIKDLRAATGMGLREAKEATDLLLGIGAHEGEGPRDEVLLNDYMIVLGDAHAEQVYQAIRNAVYIEGRLESEPPYRVASKLAIATVAELGYEGAIGVLHSQRRAVDNPEVFLTAIDLIGEVQP